MLIAIWRKNHYEFFIFSDKARVPGVITYSTCNVNTDAMMNKKTGHISVRHPGDYFLSFTANMVSVNSQAIWCAIYKQSAGNDAWQVLGMLNGFYQYRNSLFFQILFIKWFVKLEVAKLILTNCRFSIQGKFLVQKITNWVASFRYELHLHTVSYL